jgi:hypothetical protein
MSGATSWLCCNLTLRSGKEHEQEEQTRDEVDIWSFLQQKK